jgi:DNA polymerase-1
MVTIIDTFGFFFRSYHALPPLTSKSGFPTGLLTGFINFISRLKRENAEGYLVFCADSPGGSFRNQIYPEYKANRKEPDEALKQQIPVALEWIEKMGFTLMKRSNYEADDIIAAIALDAKKRGVFARIISSDKDMYQLIDDKHIIIYDAVKQKEINSAICREKFGVDPNDFINFQAILGDKSDNIPGIKGIGEKIASPLINEYKTLENIYANINSIENERIRKLLAEGKESAFLSRALVTLKADSIENINCEEFIIPQNPIERIMHELIKYDIRSILKRKTSAAYPSSASNEVQTGESVVVSKDNKEFKSILITDAAKLNAIINAIPEGAIAAFDTETDSLDFHAAALVGFSFSWEEDVGYYVAVGHRYLGVPEQIAIKDAKSAIIKLFNRARIIGQNLKFDLHILRHTLGLDRLTIYSDTMIIAWLIDPSKNVNLDLLAKTYLAHEMISFKKVTKGLKNFSELDMNSACVYSAEDAVMTLRLYPILISHLNTQDQSLSEILSNVETPFIQVLLDMEDAGLDIDLKFFETLRTQMQGKIDILVDKIYQLAGGSFNINSTSQLSDILFEKLRLSSTKKTKTGYSTDEGVLSKLVDKHPIVTELLSYRELSKLKTTYIDPFLALKSQRVYTHFSQTGTATGRLSSSEPNLQNIPTRTETGRQIRRGFIAPEGFVLLSADYSQIELRLLAHFSGDRTLIKAFNSGRDIHEETARMLFNENTKEKRSIAKSVNFGLLYGMGAQKLADDVNLSKQDAREVIDRYFAKFPTIKSYLESIKREAHLNGYVSTLLGRRRYFDFVHAGGQFTAAYEREAINTCFQGSAADLIKLAMISLNKILKGDDRIKMVLQIHDELLFRIREDFSAEAGEIIRAEMQNCRALQVPLVVSISTAKNWAELK